jgi:hypothetical protein
MSDDRGSRRTEVSTDLGTLAYLQATVKGVITGASVRGGFVLHRDLAATAPVRAFGRASHWHWMAL